MCVVSTTLPGSCTASNQNRSPNMQYGLYCHVAKLGVALTEILGNLVTRPQTLSHPVLPINLVTRPQTLSHPVPPINLVTRPQTLSHPVPPINLVTRPQTLSHPVPPINLVTRPQTQSHPVLPIRNTLVYVAVPNLFFPTSDNGAALFLSDCTVSHIWPLLQFFALMVLVLLKVPVLLYCPVLLLDICTHHSLLLAHVLEPLSQRFPSTAI